MAKIENMDQLRGEILRLKNVRNEQETLLRKDMANVREDLRPMNLLMRALSGVTGIKFDKSAFMKDGILFGLSLLFQRVVLKAEKKVEDSAYKMVDVLFEKIQNFVNKHTGRDAQREERKD